MSLRAKINYMGASKDLADFDISTLKPMTEKELRPIFHAAARRIVPRARRLLKQRIIHPEKSTGRAGRSIGWTTWGAGGRNGVTVYGGAPYFGFIERGTRYIWAKRMLREAMEEEMMPLARDIDVGCRIALRNLVRE